MSKSFRLVQMAREDIERAGYTCDLLDLSMLTAQYGRQILPCKGCVSTAMPLCHWPCTCYPNHAPGQVNDWMSEIYPRWVAAHGVMIVTPVHWYQARWSKPSDWHVRVSCRVRTGTCATPGRSSDRI
jgi:multimeric flavodoxin WrbA